MALGGLFLFAVSGFGSTIYNNFTDYSAYWHPFGYPNTATYGETFTAPNSGDVDLENFSLYLAGPIDGANGDILLSGYVATWTGTTAGTLLYSSPSVDYANTDNGELTFDTGGLTLTAGANYVAFLSVSQYYGQSSGEAWASQGDGEIPGGAFVYNNSSEDFASLFGSDWATPGAPDFAFTATFDSGGVPEPGTLTLLGAGFLFLGAIRRKLER